MNKLEADRFLYPWSQDQRQEISNTNRWLRLPKMKLENSRRRSQRVLIFVMRLTTPKSYLQVVPHRGGGQGYNRTRPGKPQSTAGISSFLYTIICHHSFSLPTFSISSPSPSADWLSPLIMIHGKVVVVPKWLPYSSSPLTPAPFTSNAHKHYHSWAY